MTRDIIITQQRNGKLLDITKGNLIWWELRAKEPDAIAAREFLKSVVCIWRAKK